MWNITSWGKGHCLVRRGKCHVMSELRRPLLVHSKKKAEQNKTKQQQQQQQQQQKTKSKPKNKENKQRGYSL